jgi:gamma-glutamyltranspeptidase/glutathione hydrolase
MVASAHPLASLAGLRMLMQGGNAVDAAVATAAALNVCEPYMSGIGGVGYMVIYTASDGKLRTLDYIGRSARAATPDAFATQAEKDHGPMSPLVPGAAGGWLTALEEAGRLDAATVFAPAIEYADGGVPITLKNEVFFTNAAPHLEPESRATFLPGGTVPKPGTILKQPLLAETFREVVTGGKEVFYRGAIAEKIVRFLESRGGLLTEQDLAEFQPEWQETVSTNYRGFDIHCPPPPCSGFQYLQTLNILEGFDIAGSGQNSADTLHVLAEAMKLAVADRIAYTARPDAPFAALLSKEYAEQRRSLIDLGQAQPSEGERFDGHLTAGVITAGIPRECTTHFDTVDAEGNAVSVTQTLGDGFGSGVMASETGVMLNNFNYWFDLDRDSPNVIGPVKKVEMCLAPAAVLRDGRLFMVIGTPGSFGIMETTPQMISNVLDHGFSIQAAIEAPRIRTFEGTAISIEARVPESVRAELARRGHDLQLLEDWSFSVGGGQGIMVDPDSGARLGGADPRRDGYAMGW